MKVHVQVHSHRHIHQNPDSRSKKPEKIVRYGVKSVHLLYDFQKRLQKFEKEKFQQNC